MFKFKVGDYVRVTAEFQCIEFPQEDTSHWGGKVIKAYKGDSDENQYVVQLDATTLCSYSLPYFKYLDDGGYSYDEYVFDENDLVTAEPRNVKDELKTSLLFLTNRLGIFDHEEEEDVEDNDELDAVQFKNKVYNQRKIKNHSLKPVPRPWAKFSKNAIITVVYKDGKQKTGKFKRLEADLDKGLCDLL